MAAPKTNPPLSFVLTTCFPGNSAYILKINTDNCWRSPSCLVSFYDEGLATFFKKHFQVERVTTGPLQGCVRVGVNPNGTEWRHIGSSLRGGGRCARHRA